MQHIDVTEMESNIVKLFEDFSKFIELFANFFLLVLFFSFLQLALLFNFYYKKSDKDGKKNRQNDWVGKIVENKLILHLQVPVFVESKIKNIYYTFFWVD